MISPLKSPPQHSPQVHLWNWEYVLDEELGTVACLFRRRRISHFRAGFLATGVNQWSVIQQPTSTLGKFIRCLSCQSRSDMNTEMRIFPGSRCQIPYGQIFYCRPAHTHSEGTKIRWTPTFFFRKSDITFSNKLRTVSMNILGCHPFIPPKIHSLFIMSIWIRHEHREGDIPRIHMPDSSDLAHVCLAHACSDWKWSSAAIIWRPIIRDKRHRILVH